MLIRRLGLIDRTLFEQGITGRDNLQDRGIMELIESPYMHVCLWSVILQPFQLRGGTLQEEKGGAI